MNQFVLRLWIVAAVLLTAHAAAVRATELKLHERVSSDSAVVRLGDVADITSDDVQEQRRLARLLLMPAPAPGTQRFVRQREVQDVLQAHGEDVGQLRITGSNLISVTSPEIKKDNGT